MSSSPFYTDEATRRVQRRKRLLWLTVPIALVIAVFVAKIASQAIIYAMGSSAYNAGHYQTAAQRFERLKTINVISPHLPYYDKGTALLKAGDLHGAEEQLWTALDTTPDADRCAVSTNLMLSLEWQGDLLVQSGQYADGKQLYVLAASVNADSLCPQQEQQQNQDRLEEKQDSAQEQQDQQDQQDQQGQGGGGSSGEPSPDPSASPSPSPSGGGGGGESPTPTPTPSNGEGGEGSSPTPTPSNGGGGGGPSPTPSQGTGDDKLDELNQKNNDAQNQDDYGNPPSQDQPMNW